MIEPQADFSIAVVIPLFNKERAIESAIASVLAQHRLPEELVVVDDGSTDESFENARQAMAKAPEAMRCSLLSQANAGVSAARNRGVEESTTGYVAFLDADDEWDPGCIAELERLASACPSATLLSVRLAKRTPEGTIIPESSGLQDFFGLVPNPLEAYAKGYGILSSSSAAVRRDAWSRSGGFPVNARKGEDVFLWLGLIMNGSFAHSSAPLSFWRDHYSGFVRRNGVVPYHLAHFLGTAEGRRELASCAALSNFIESNLVVQVASHILVGDRAVAETLCRFAATCSLRTRLKCAAALHMPQRLLVALSSWIRRARRRPRSTQGRVRKPRSARQSS